MCSTSAGGGGTPFVTPLMLHSLSPQPSAQPLGLRACLWAACRALCRCFGCARVDLAQPFSLKVQWCGVQLGLLWWSWLPESSSAPEDVLQQCFGLCEPCGVLQRGSGCWGARRSAEIP